MRPSRDARFDHINDTLRAGYEAILDEPLPRRWVDLINVLNERERADEARNLVGRSQI